MSDRKIYFKSSKQKEVYESLIAEGFRVDETLDDCELIILSKKDRPLAHLDADGDIFWDDQLIGEV